MAHTTSAVSLSIVGLEVCGYPNRSNVHVRSDGISLPPTAWRHAIGRVSQRVSSWHSKVMREPGDILWVNSITGQGRSDYTIRAAHPPWRAPGQAMWHVLHASTCLFPFHSSSTFSSRSHSPLPFPHPNPSLSLSPLLGTGLKSARAVRTFKYKRPRHHEKYFWFCIFPVYLTVGHMTYDICHRYIFRFLNIRRNPRPLFICIEHIPPHIHPQHFCFPFTCPRVSPSLFPVFSSQLRVVRQTNRSLR